MVTDCLSFEDNLHFLIVYCWRRRQRLHIRVVDLESVKFGNACNHKSFWSRRLARLLACWFILVNNHEISENTVAVLSATFWTHWCQLWRTFFFVNFHFIYFNMFIWKLIYTNKGFASLKIIDYLFIFLFY